MSSETFSHFVFIFDSSFHFLILRIFVLFYYLLFYNMKFLQRLF